jgi:hypothetical protein
MALVGSRRRPIEMFSGIIEHWVAREGKNMNPEAVHARLSLALEHWAFREEGLSENQIETPIEGCSETEQP